MRYTSEEGIVYHEKQIAANHIFRFLSIMCLGIIKFSLCFYILVVLISYVIFIVYLFEVLLITNLYHNFIFFIGYRDNKG